VQLGWQIVAWQAAAAKLVGAGRLKLVKSRHSRFTEAKMSLIPEIKPQQSLELLKELHILTRDGKINQDTRRKLKQVYHLYQFIEPLMQDVLQSKGDVSWPTTARASPIWASSCTTCSSRTEAGRVFGIETRPELVSRSEELAARLGFDRMGFST
jgi:hypothetical protein